MNRDIGLTRANGLSSLPALFEKRAGEAALWSIFEREGLPLAVLEDPNTPVPLVTTIGVLTRASNHIGDRLFAFEVGEAMAMAPYGLWGAYGRAAPTLLEGIRRYCETVSSHQTGSQLELVREGTRLIWRYVVPTYGRDLQAHTDHNLSPMLQFCRYFLGDTWLPDWFDVNYPPDADAHLLEEKLGRPIRFRQQGSGLVLKPNELQQALKVQSTQPARPVTLREVNADLLLANAPEPARALSAIVTLRLLDGHTDIDGAARMAQMSVQSLQRRLRDKGFTYREIVGRARQRRAESLLAETDMRVVDIALALGYEEHANFTRAFKAAAGVSPADFRRACRQPIEAHTRPKRQLPG